MLSFITVYCLGKHELRRISRSHVTIQMALAPYSYFNLFIQFLHVYIYAFVNTIPLQLDSINKQL